MTTPIDDTRRRFLQIAAAAGATLALAPGCTMQSPGPRWIERREAYPQGVASGDPAADSVIVWTRREPATPDAVHTLHVEVARDAQFADVAVTGSAEVTAASDWTCRVLVAGLAPGREYWYRFTDESGAGSRVGRTLTAPADDDARAVRFAFVSCQDPTQGGLNAWRRMIFDDEQRDAAERLGFVLHLGDFIYEVVWYPEDRTQGMYNRRLRDLIRYPQGEKVRDFHVPVTLADYRTAYRAYLQDPDLQDARARWPFVPVWDNHEFSWRGWQSVQVFGEESRPAQQVKVAANQAWFEYQPARVRMPNHAGLDKFAAPTVTNAEIDTYDALGLGTEPNNLLAVQSLQIHRALRYGRHVDLIITDNHSYRAEPEDTSAITPANFRWMVPQDAFEILDGGSGYAGGQPPDTLRYDGKDLPNTRKDSPPQSYLGIAQKRWLLERLEASTATWKIWGHSAGTLVWRTDMQNMPAGVGPKWPSESYALWTGGFGVENGEVFDFIRDKGIVNFAIVAGDKHSFWAGRPSKALPPEEFEPVGVEFITGSISTPGLFEVAESVVPKDDPLRALYVQDGADGKPVAAMNMTLLHGVRAALELQRTGDAAAAKALSNPDVAPHLAFADLGGHGFATIRAGADGLESEFVCIPRPLERIATPDGGPVAYRARHRVKPWAAGETPVLEAQPGDGVPDISTA